MMTESLAKDMPDLEALSAYEKASGDGGLDPRCIPQYLDGAPPVGAAIVPQIGGGREHDVEIVAQRRKGLVWVGVGWGVHDAVLSEKRDA